MARKGTVRRQLAKKDEDIRPIRWRRYPYLFLIVCEDQKTEPYYFAQFIKQFPRETVFLRTVGTGRSSIGVVEQSVIEREKLLQEANKQVDEVWAVFDKDDAQKSVGNTMRFNNAFKLVSEEKINIAYSNEVFELWILLHFTDVDPEPLIPRGEIYSRLQTAINGIPAFKQFVYDHGNVNIIHILNKRGNEKKANDRAAKLLAEHRKNGTSPINANPSTTVHRLVKRLRELITWYSYQPE